MAKPRKSVVTPVAIRPAGAPPPIGPYSPGLRSGEWLFVSGQTASDPVTGVLVSADIEDQTRQTLRNAQAVLEAAGLDWGDVVRVGVYLTDMSAFERMNTVYRAVLGKAVPARTTIGVAALPKGASVEVDLIARVPGGE